MTTQLTQPSGFATVNSPTGCLQGLRIPLADFQATAELLNTGSQHQEPVQRCIRQSIFTLCSSDRLHCRESVNRVLKIQKRYGKRLD
jgi:hypothetical protein